MLEKIRSIRLPEVGIFFAMVLVQALAWSKALLAISVGGLMLVSLLHTPIRQYISNFWKNKHLLALSLLFFVVLSSGLWSENEVYWLERLRIKLPFLLIPLAMANLPIPSKRQFYSILYFFVLAVVVMCVWHLAYYFTHFETSNKGLKQGIPIQSIKGHISFITVAVFAFFCAIELWQKAFIWRKTWEQRLMLFFAVFLFITIHILSIRTGLLLLYVGLFLRILVFIFQEKRWRLGLFLLLGLGSLPFIAYQTIPSFKGRIGYMMWEREQAKQGDVKQKSDSERLISLKVGIKIWQENILLGVGFGDLMDKVKTNYATDYPDFKIKEPHSALVFWLASVGLFGLFLFSITLFSHFWVWYQTRISLFGVLIIILLLSNVVDYIAESTTCVHLWAFFVSLFIRFYDEEL